MDSSVAGCFRDPVMSGVRLVPGLEVAEDHQMDDHPLLSAAVVLREVSCFGVCLR